MTLQYQREVVRNIVEDSLTNKIVRESEYQFASSIIPVEKECRRLKNFLTALQATEAGLLWRR